MTSLELHIDNWKNCKLCELHKTRTQVVMGRGDIPADLLICGEAPGKSEDVVGIPFCGPAGKLLDQIIAESIPSNYTVAFTNLVACLPIGDEGNKTEEPPVESIKACAPRLIEFVEIAKPKLIVCVGALSRDYLDSTLKHSVKIDPNIPRVSIEHPAAILRANEVMKGIKIKRCVIVLQAAIERYLK